MKRRGKGPGMGRNGKKMNDEEEGIYRRRRKENEVAVWGEEKKMKEKNNVYSCHCTSGSYYVSCRLL